MLNLVSAFAGQEKIFRAHREAVREKYRFYSFGDAVVYRLIDIFVKSCKDSFK